MILKMAYYGDPILRKKASPITKITPEIKILVNDMIETMQERKGVGLAAPQIHHSISLFITQFSDRTKEDEWVPGDILVFVNPKILEINEELDEYSEGCLSIPGLYEDVLRPTKIKITAQDLEGNTFVKELQDYEARVCLHENDHLNGVLFIDRLSPKKKNEIDPLLRAIKKKYSPK